MNVNEAVAQLALDEFVKDRYEYDAEKHGTREELSIEIDEIYGSCACYSEQTRDDYMYTVFIVHTKTEDVKFEFSHRWMSDDLINAIEKYMELPSIETYCNYESDEE